MPPRRERLGCSRCSWSGTAGRHFPTFTPGGPLACQSACPPRGSGRASITRSRRSLTPRTSEPTSLIASMRRFVASVTPSFVAKVRVGLPSPKSAVKNRDPGVTNVRRTDSPHWLRWLGSANRCLVPFTSFSEFNEGEGGNVWFALDESRPLAFFAGIHVPQWTSVRKVKAGEETADLYAFLTTERTPSSRRSIQGHAGDPDPSRAMGFLVARAVGRGAAASTAASGCHADDRRSRLERRRRGSAGHRSRHHERAGRLGDTTSRPPWNCISSRGGAVVRPHPRHSNTSGRCCANKVSSAQQGHCGPCRAVRGKGAFFGDLDWTTSAPPFLGRK